MFPRQSRIRYCRPHDAAWDKGSAAARLADDESGISPDQELWTALQQMDRDGVNQLPVMTASQVVGRLSREDVITFLRKAQELGNLPTQSFRLTEEGINESEK